MGSSCWCLLLVVSTIKQRRRRMWRWTSQVHVRGHPGGKLGMLCRWLSSSPLGSTALPQSHNYPLLRQAYALTASETPPLSPTFCLLPVAAICPSTQQNLTLLTALPLSLFPLSLSLLSLVASIRGGGRCCTASI